MITVNKKALCEKDDGGEDCYPEVGDQIDLGDVTGTVKAVNGDNYDIDIDSVRGVKAASPADDAAGGDPDADADDDSSPAGDSDADSEAYRGADLPKDDEGKALRKKVLAMDKRRMG